MSQHAYRWSPITDLTADWQSLASEQTHTLVQAWQEQVGEFQTNQEYGEFLVKLRRQWAIETGVLERLYTLSEGATKTLIEKGLDAALIGDADTDRSPRLVLAMIRDQHAALDGLYQFVSNERPLGTSYIKELHRVLTANQDHCDARNQFGQLVREELSKGAWKKRPNTIEFEDGTRFEFCPPEQVDAEIERLLRWHHEHEIAGVPPDIEAAWLHHRFSLIHPFQDGNGRVARCLATLILLKARWFPLVVVRADRDIYIEALQSADKHDLGPLVKLVDSLQRKAIREALSLSDEIKQDRASRQEILRAAESKLSKREEELKGKIANVLRLGDVLQHIAYDELEDIAAHVEKLVKEKNTRYSAWVVGAPRTAEEKAEYYNIQIVQCAKALGYYANRDVFRAWAVLVIQTSTRHEVLFSFHGIGRDSRGVLVCAPMMWQKETVPDDSGRPETRFGDVVPLSVEPFAFTYLDDEKKVVARFRRWVNGRVTEALRRWTENL